MNALAESATRLITSGVDCTGLTHDGSTVVRRLEQDGKRQWIWECRCACGATYRRRAMEIQSAVRGGPYRLRCRDCTRARLRELGRERRRTAA